MLYGRPFLHPSHDLGVPDGLTLGSWIPSGTFNAEVSFQQVNGPIHVSFPKSWSLDVSKDLEERVPAAPAPTSRDRTSRAAVEHPFLGEASTLKVQEPTGSLHPVNKANVEKNPGWTSKTLTDLKFRRAGPKKSISKCDRLLGYNSSPLRPWINTVQELILKVQKSW